PSSIPNEVSTPFGSLVGSYEESILTGRMSTLPSLPLWFIAQMGVLGSGPGCPSKLRCPPHISIDFPAYFYTHEEESAPSPYVGTLDLALDPSPRDLGYRIPGQGRLQIIIKNSQKTAVRLFLIPYNLQDMPIGYKTFLRQMIYRETVGKPRRVLGSAIHLHIRRTSRTRWYVYGPVRVVFGHRVLEQGIGDHEVVETGGPQDPQWVP
ncbi:hypothetical protein BJ684DRAFT_5951, partial [Piptocephalis cylindrospora]